ncbi:secreted protein [Melampsora americana]|nr:secreted protein [Melampsora americana]
MRYTLISLLFSLSASSVYGSTIGARKTSDLHTSTPAINSTSNSSSLIPNSIDSPLANGTTTLNDTAIPSNDPIQAKITKLEAKIVKYKQEIAHEEEKVAKLKAKQQGKGQGKDDDKKGSDEKKGHDEKKGQDEKKHKEHSHGKHGKEADKSTTEKNGTSTDPTSNGTSAVPTSNGTLTLPTKNVTSTVLP